METQRESRLSIKRDLILDAATAAFRDEGYECTSMDRIAELAGASKRTVYNHFGSKEALFQAVVARLFDDAAALKQVEWDPDRPIEHQLADFARAKTLMAEDEASLCLARVVLGVFVLLVGALRSTRDALLVMLNLPLALIGGVVGVFASGGVLSMRADRSRGCRRVPVQFSHQMAPFSTTANDTQAT